MPKHFAKEIKMKRKHKRLTFVAVALVLLGASTAMFLSAIEENITLFVSPTDVAEKKYAQEGHGSVQYACRYHDHTDMVTRKMG